MPSPVDILFFRLVETEKSDPIERSSFFGKINMDILRVVMMRQTSDCLVGAIETKQHSRN